MTHSEFDYLLGSIDALSEEQMRRLWRELDSRLATPVAQGERPLTELERTDQDAQRRLLAAGVISEIKPSRRITTDTEQLPRPISIQGEPLS